MENLNNDEPKIIEGGVSVDDRGEVFFVNGFSFPKIKRFYMVENFSTETIRAWHGHLEESKYALVVSGSAIIAAVKMDNTTNPNKKNEVHRFVLSERKPSILYIPKGYANGFRPLEGKTKIIFFSDSELEKSKNDDYRFPTDYWGMDIWNIENR